MPVAPGPAEVNMQMPGALVLIAAVVGLFLCLYAVARNEVVRRALTCPRTGERADVEVLQRFEGRRKPIRIKSCSLFADPRNVTCAQDCLRVET